MFVGTKKQAQEAIAEQATRVGMPYVNQRWLGGMLTNFQTVHQRINRLKELDEIDFDDVAGSSRTKKELLQMRRERDKLNKSLGGIREMSRTPVRGLDRRHQQGAPRRRGGAQAADPDHRHPRLQLRPRPGRLPDPGQRRRHPRRRPADPRGRRRRRRGPDRPLRRQDRRAARPPGAEEPLAEWERELLGGDAEKAAETATGGDAADRGPGRRGHRCRRRGRRGRRDRGRRRGADGRGAPPRSRRPRSPGRGPCRGAAAEAPRPRSPAEAAAEEPAAEEPPPRSRRPRPPPRSRPPRRRGRGDPRRGDPADEPEARRPPSPDRSSHRTSTKEYPWHSPLPTSSGSAT